jgi:hypothetical protein
MIARRYLFGAPLLILAVTAPEVRAEAPTWWADHVDFMTRNGGRWRTPNPAASGDASLPEAFGMTWLAVNNRLGMTGRLYGLRGNDEGEEYWTLREFIHPGRKVVILEQWGGPGVYGQGETRSTRVGATETDQMFWLPDGRSWREGHRAVETGDIYRTAVFDIDTTGTWTSRTSNDWVRQPQVGET